MLTSLALVFLVGLSAAFICRRLRAPRIIGMLVTGVILGPFVLDLLDPSLLGISAELRQIALVIILIKAGLSLDIADLRRVGRPALMLSFLPALFEIGAFTFLAPLMLDVTRLEGAVMGAVLGAVSPAVVVPKMVSLIEGRYGTDKSIPQMLLAGTSLDDVFVIVLFSAFVGMAQGMDMDALAFASIPVSIVLGIALGAAAGLAVTAMFRAFSRHGESVRDSLKVIVIIGVSFLMIAVEELLEGKVSVSGLLAVMSLACVVRLRSRPEVTADLSSKFGKLWLAAEIILFVMVGAAVNIPYTLKAGLAAVVMIAAGLAFRSAGVWLCMLGTELNSKERLFCVIAYLPKATVQAAIGGVPLSLGLRCGNIVLSAAVLSIILTAPLGAFGMELTYKKLLRHET